MSDASFGAFGDLLRHYRLTAGLSQEELATRSHLSTRAISDLERGQRLRPRRDTVHLLADALSLADPSRARLEEAARRARFSRTGSAATPDPSPSADAARWSDALTSQPSPLIGREHEVQEARSRLLRPEVRLLTLTGVGGTGKTRLALEVARSLQASFADGVYVVDLAPILDPSLVPPTIARALSVQSGVGLEARDLLARVLRSKQLLLLLNNFEQVLTAAPPLTDLLAHCPGLKLLVTSRIPLHLRWEHELPVRPLPVPDLTRLPDAEHLAGSPAVRLFVERARAVKANFALDSAVAPVVAEICVRLDGLPLAIELIAPQVKAFAPATLLDRLRQQSGLPRSPAPDRPARHRTLQAALDWSYDLLSPGEQILFRRLAIFSGGWTLEALEAVSRGMPDSTEQFVRPIDVLDALSRLVDQSLVVVDEFADSRYHLLETIREYARIRLRGSDEEQMIAARHRRWCLEFVEHADRELRGARQNLWMSRLATERDNLRAALASGLEDDPEACVRLAAGLWRFWRQHGDFTEGLRWLDAALGRAGDEPAPAARGWALLGAGILHGERGSFEQAKSFMQQALVILRARAEQLGIAQALRELGKFQLMLGDDAAEIQAVLRESLDVAQSTGDDRGVGWALVHLGHLASAQGDVVRAWKLYEEALARFRWIRDDWSIGWTVWHLGWLGSSLRDHQTARRYLDEAGDIFQHFGHKQGQGMTLLAVSRLLIAEGDWRHARELQEQGAGRFKETGSPGVFDVLSFLGQSDIQLGDHARGVRLLAVGATGRRRYGSLEAKICPTCEGEWDASLARARAALGETAFVRAWRQGEAMSPEEAIAEATSRRGKEDPAPASTPRI